MKSPWKILLTSTLLILFICAAIGCGGNASSPAKSPGTSAQNLVDPSGNWRMNFTDASAQTFLLSGLFSQTGAVVTGLSFSEEGNGPTVLPPTPFNCVAQTDIAMTNGIVQNVNQFSGTLTGNFGTLAFSSMLNDAGTHAQGTYTLTPGAAGDCLGIALTGTFVGDEIPSMTGNWSGTVTCVTNCATGSTTGTITMALTQNDSTGAVNGTYTVTGFPGLTSGTVASNLTDLRTGIDILSGSSWQDSLTDNNGASLKIAGGPFNTFGGTGLTTDGSFGGNIFGFSTYAVTMKH